MRTKLIALRKSRNYSQNKIAEKAKINRSYYGFIEKGIRNPSYPIAVRIAEIFSLKVEEVFPEDIFFCNRCYVEKQKDVE